MYSTKDAAIAPQDFPEGFQEVVDAMCLEQDNRPWASYLTGQGPLQRFNAFEPDPDETEEARKIRKGLARIEKLDGLLAEKTREAKAARGASRGGSRSGDRGDGMSEDGSMRSSRSRMSNFREIDAAMADDLPRLVPQPVPLIVMHRERYGL